MPRRNLSVLSSSEDPYTLDRFPRAFAVAIGKQTYNARQLAKAAKVKGQYLDMYRQPIPGNKVREILALTGQRPHANTGRFMPASGLAKVRKLAKRELRARQGKAVVGPMQYGSGRSAPRGAEARFDERANLRGAIEERVRTSEILARGQFRELDAHGVFRGYDEAQRDGAEFGLRHHFAMVGSPERDFWPSIQHPRLELPGWDDWFRGRYGSNYYFVPNEIRARAELVSRLPSIQSLPAHAQEVARRFAAMTPGALDALTHVPPPRRSARPRHR